MVLFLVIIHLSQNKSNKEDEMSGAVIEEFVGLKIKMYLFFVGDSSEHRKQRM